MISTACFGCGVPNIKFNRVDSTLLTGHKTLHIPETFQQILSYDLASQKKQCYTCISMWTVYIYTKSYIDIHTQNHRSTKNTYIRTYQSCPTSWGPERWLFPQHTTFHQATLSPISEAPKCPASGSMRVALSLNPSSLSSLSSNRLVVVLP